MSVGILTFHAGFNHGAFLQAFALQNALFRLNVQNTIINYINWNQYLKEYRFALWSKNVFLLGEKANRVRKFIKSRKKFYQTKRIFNADQKIINQFDAVIFGSDEIWNLDNCVFGYDSVYFGDQINTKKLAYAPSFGSTNAGSGIPANINKNLKKFDLISVRDQNSYDILKENISIDPQIVPDPTFIYDILHVAKNCNKKNFILIYANDLRSNFVKKIKKFAIDSGKRIISIGYRKNWADENFTNITPFELLGYFLKSDFVFTDLFHGTIFSVLANKNFILQLSEYRKNKFYPMLKVLDIEDRVYTAADFEQVVKSKIDYTYVNERVKQYKNTGLNFLRIALNL